MISAKDELSYYVSCLNEAESQRLLNVLDNLPTDPEESGRIASVRWILMAASRALKKEKKGKLGMSCDVCGYTVPSFECAVAAGFYPETWLSDMEPGPAPVCLECVDNFFEESSGEPTLRPPGEFLC